MAIRNTHSFRAGRACTRAPTGMQSRRSFRKRCSDRRSRAAIRPSRFCAAARWPKAELKHRRNLQDILDGGLHDENNLNAQKEKNYES